MVKYHINPEGNVGVCRAVKRPCPLGSPEDHFSSQTEALAHAEKTLAAELSPKPRILFQEADDLRKLSPQIPEDLQFHKELSLKGLAHLSELEQAALRGYGGLAAAIVNNRMLGEVYEPYDKAPNWRETQGPVDFNSIEELEDYIEVLDSVFSKRGEQERILYRGIPIYTAIREEMEELIGETIKPHETEKMIEGLEAYFQEGKIIEYPTYLSTSHDPDVAAERTDNTINTGNTYWSPEPEILGIQLEIKTNAGLDITGIAKKHWAREREVVLPRNLKFKVEKLIIKPQEYKTLVDGEIKVLKGLGAIVQMSEVKD